MTTAIAASLSAAVCAQVRHMGDISFVQSAEWRYNVRPDGVVQMGRNEGPHWVKVELYGSTPSTGNSTTDLRILWRRIGLPGNPPLILDQKTLVGYPGQHAAIQMENGHDLTMYVLEAHGWAIPLVAEASSSAYRNDIARLLGELIESVRIAPDQAVPPKMRMTMADLAGEWHEAGDSSAMLVDASGNLVGFSVIAHGETRTIHPDGKYSYRFGGTIKGRIIRDEGAGTVTLNGNAITFRQENGHTEVFQLIAFQKGVNGVTVMTVAEVDSTLRTGPQKWARQEP